MGTLSFTLPESYENFKCAIKSRDALPDPETLRTKILDESTTRKLKPQEGSHSVMLARKTWQKSEKEKQAKSKRPIKSEKGKSDGNFRFKCHNCRKVGHKAMECPEKKEKAGLAKEEFILGISDTDITHCITPNPNKYGWCLDSGYTSHLCNSREYFIQITDEDQGKLNLASHSSK